MNVKEAIEKLYRLQSKMSAYNHAMSLIFFDGATIAPKESAKNRAHTLGILSEETYLLMTGKETVELLEYLDEKKDELSEKDQRIVYLSLKSIREMQKIPMEEYVAYQELVSESETVWHEAKENNDFASFLPYLDKIFETNLKFAGYCAPDKDPYDYYLSQYEDGLTKEKCDEFFSTLREHIVPLIKEISRKPSPDDSCIKGHFPKAEQEKFSYELMKTIGISADRCGLAETEHPFTTSLGSHFDVRITTNYDEENLASSMYSVIHEGGHALYDMNSDDGLAYTCLDGGVSMGIHESQSRFYENIIGRSLVFVEKVFPLMQEAFPEQMKGYSAQDVYRAVNLVTPSLIRTEADEVTYCLHVMVRYELEKRMLAGEIKAKDLPSEWNRLYKEYLGVDVPSDREGVLQDSHWAGGAIGYFPSYALGSAYGAHLYAKMNSELDVEKCIAEGDFERINEWNREHIWKFGSLKRSSDLLSEALGEEFDPLYYTRYLEEKYKKLYDMK